jgi:uncharacterized protein (UPF0216 family)
MRNQSSAYDGFLQTYLRDELRVLNAHLPKERKSLGALLEEEHPHLVCNDGTTHSFRRKELQHLASILSGEERESLLLPILIEYTPEAGQGQVLSGGDVDAKVVSTVLGTTVTPERGRIKIFGYQLSTLRRVLRTTTQYVFSVKPRS